MEVANTLDISDGGPARNAYELNKALNQKTFVQAQLVFINGSIEESVVLEDQLSTAQTPSPFPQKLSTWSVIWTVLIGRKKLQEQPVVIIHGYYLIWAPIIALAARLGGNRVLLMPHGALTVRQQGYSKLRKAVFDRTLGFVLRTSIHSFVTGSEVEAEELCAKFPGVKVDIAGVGVPPQSSRKSETSTKSPLQLLSLSRIAPKKRIELSIEAVSVLKQRGIASRLTIAGVGASGYEQSLRRIAEVMGVRGDVDFVGQVVGIEKEALYLNSDVYLLPSEDENFGISFAEAISYGLPAVVSVNVAAAKGYPSSAGATLKDPSPKAIADSIERLIPDESYRTAQRDSYQFAITEFSWESVVNRWLQIAEDPKKLQD